MPSVRRGSAGNKKRETPRSRPRRVNDKPAGYSKACPVCGKVLELVKRRVSVAGRHERVELAVWPNHRNPGNRKCSGWDGPITQESA